jgi:CBS domain containing-hemolysin-like protein
MSKLGRDTSNAFRLRRAKVNPLGATPAAEIRPGKLWFGSRLRLPLPLLVLSLPGVALLGAAAVVDGMPSLRGLLVPAAVVVLLVLLNGLFVAAEFAIIGVRHSQLEELVAEGHQRAARVLADLEAVAQDRYIATAQVGITMASLGLGMYAEPQIAYFIEPYLALLLGVDIHPAVVHTVAVLIGLSVLTYLHIVLGEMVPKSLALSRPIRTALVIAPAMRLAQAILIIPVRFLNAISGALLRVFRIPPAHGHARLHSPEELELIVAESAEGGLLNQEEEEMIRNIFDFSERQVGQVMTPRPKVQAISYDMPQAELLNFVTESTHSRFPVYEGDVDHIIGILNMKDLVRQHMRTKGNFDIRLILRPAPGVPEDLAVAQLLAAFRRQRIHMAVVLDEFGGMAGIVTLEDLVEEVVGEVRDEFDFETEPLVELAPGRLEVAGSYLLDDLKERVYLGEDESLPDVETVGGLIITALGRPPKRGDRLIYNNEVHFTVIDIDGLAVARAQVEFPVDTPAEPVDMQDRDELV